MFFSDIYSCLNNFHSNSVSSFLVTAAQELGVGIEGMVITLWLAPEVGGQEGVGVLKSVEGGSDEVTLGSGLSLRTGVNVTDTGQLEDLLGGGGSNDAGTSGGGDESNSDGAAFSGDLGGDGVSVTDLVTPITSSDGDQVELGVGNGTLDGTLDFLGALPAQTDVTVGVTDDDVGFESGSLTGLGLLLDGLDLHNLLLKSFLQEEVNDVGLLDGDGPSEDIFDGSDFSALDESS